MSKLNAAEALPKIVRVVPRNRNIEAFLLAFAVGLNAFELSQIQLSLLKVLTPEIFLYLLPPAFFALVIHIILRRRASEADPMILPIAVVLNGLGLSMIYRLDLATIANGGTELFAEKQVVWTVVAMAFAAAVIIFVPSHLFLRRYVYVSMIVGVGLLISPMIPGLGRNINGAQLWIAIGDLTFQPGELAKIALTVFFAGYLVTRRESLAIVGRKVLGVRIPRARELGPILVIWGASLLVLILQRDLGTSLLYFGIFIVLVYTATGRAIYVIAGITMFLTGALVAGRMMEYVSGRVDSWLNPFLASNYDAAGGSYQLAQGIFGLAHGGLLGTGLGGGLPQLVPLAESDFIIAALGEEIGLIGLFAVFALYLLLVSRGIRIGFNHPDDFSKLLATGLAFVIALQCFIVIGGVTRVVPLTGLTTPLLAAGGSSLLANWIIVGLLLRISDTVDSGNKSVNV
ncbi:FtsW/RodA/SpoVE family cell cycle protein [Rhodoluna limnophila]|jgi:cell division protein FtsW (lipid II flippase)|uniref:FtsW/RodA/SpoVE family cell cycle protein n=1 Tax=Rhodoluna limnophila TaxID=232537 RepID=UPI00110751B1|nr:FtsW/RodA/SpoVE family cell cycle protein [Rhodoluna limnophila]